MANDDLDLKAGERESPRQRRQRRSAGSTEKEAPRSRQEPSEHEVRGLLSRAFDNLAKNRTAKGDDELAAAFTEEADAMSEGVITLTGAVPPLRMAVVLLLNVVVTLLAFGRVGGILLSRWQERRAERSAAASEQYAPTEYGPGGVPIEVTE